MFNRTSTKASTTSQEELRGKITALVVVLVLLLIVIIATILLLWRFKKLDGSYKPDLDDRAVEWTGQLIDAAQQAQKTESASEIQIPGYPSIAVEAGSNIITAALINPEGNPCYFTFTMTLADTGEVLFTTSQVAPGQMISQVEMNRSFTAGEYTVILTVSTSSLEDGSPMNGANMETLLVVY